MRFYLDPPLVIGYVLMATTACLGMLQLAAARGGYVGLALFATERKRGVRIGLGLTASALLAYVLFAPEILTPGPAGTEVAEMFTLCALTALSITLVGADRRIKRERETSGCTDEGEPVMLGDLSATLHRPTTSPPDPVPAVVLLPDPAGFVVAPAALGEGLRQAGIAVLALDARGVGESDDPLSRQTLLGHLSTALVQLAQQAGIDGKRTGLVGLGLGGDAVLHAAATDPQVQAALAVSPVGGELFNPGAAASGLHWLRELSYRQIWRWRRGWPALRRAADLISPVPTKENSTLSPNQRDAAGGTKPTQDDFSATSAVLQGSDAIFTIRNTRHDVELLTVPSQRYFTLLEDQRARQFAVNWLQQKLTRNTQHTTHNTQQATRNE